MRGKLSEPNEDHGPLRGDDQAALEACLEQFLKRELPLAQGLRIVALAPLEGGNAREAWSFDVVWREADTSHRKRCVLLQKAPAGQLDRDLGPEFRVLETLEGTDVPAPRAYWIDVDGRALGRPAFVLERVGGSAELRSLLDPARGSINRALARALAAAAAALHQVDWRARGVDFLGEPSADEVARAQVDEWEALFLRHRMEPLPVLAAAFCWLRENAPRAERVAIVHGDLRFGNFLYEGDQLRALLDWEMVHLGDPCEDLAWAYRSLWNPEAQLPFDAFLAHYRASGGASAPAENLLFYRLFGEVKHAVISLCGAHAFATGQTRNLRLADRMSWVPECLAHFLDWLPPGRETA